MIAPSCEHIPMAQYFMENCAWCWKAKFPGVPFPEDVSSDICADHSDWLLARLAARRKPTTVNFVLVGEVESLKPCRAPLHVKRISERRFEKRYSSYPPNWPRVIAVLRRSVDSTCEACGLHSNKLCVHHAGTPFANGNPGNHHNKWDIRRANLRVLCPACHEQADYELLARETEQKRKHRALGVGVGLVPIH